MSLITVKRGSTVRLWTTVKMDGSGNEPDSVTVSIVDSGSVAVVTDQSMTKYATGSYDPSSGKTLTKYYYLWDIPTDQAAGDYTFTPNPVSGTHADLDDGVITVTT